MDTLRDRLAELADDAPTGGAPAAELWARGKRAHRLRATALVSMVLVVVAVGARLGVGLPDGKPAVLLAPGGAGGLALPIEYPVGEELPDLGDTPGPLAAVWLVPRGGGGTPEVVGLVAETGMFGTLPIELPRDWNDGLYEAHESGVVVSPDGRRIAVGPGTDELVVRDLVSGRTYSPAFEFQPRPGRTVWIDDTRLVGHDRRGSDVDGWVWEPGTAPQQINLGAFEDFPYLGYIGPYGKDLLVPGGGSGPRTCSPPIVEDLAGRFEVRRAPDGSLVEGPVFNVPMLCDVLDVVGSEILLGHWNSDHSPGDWTDADDGNTTVVALDISDADVECGPPCSAVVPLDRPAVRRVVVTAGAPERVSFAKKLIGEALDADGDGS